MVETFFRVSQTLAQVADIAVRQVLDMKKDETVLIITNPIEDVLKISQAFLA
jgi:hypothetical protein